MADSTSLAPTSGTKQAAASEELSGVLRAVKRLPGQLAGSGVDLANLVLGLVAGKGTDGITPKPVGGSESLNSLVGLGGSTGAAQDMADTVLGFVDPKSLVKGAIGTGAAMIVPAIRLKDFRTRSVAEDIDEASDMTMAGAPQSEVYAKTEVYFGAVDNKPKAVMPDQGMLAGMISASSGYFNVPDRSRYSLPEVYKDSTLYEVMPELKNVDVQPGPGAGFYRDEQIITMPTFKTAKEFTSTLLHEIQHAVQLFGGFEPGGNPDQFLKNPAAWAETSRKVATKIQTISKAIEAQYGPQVIFDAISSIRFPKRYGPPQELLNDPAFKELQKYGQIQATIDRRNSLNMAKYRRIAGEAEARGTQYMFETGRYDLFPLASPVLDVPAAQLTPSPFSTSLPTKRD